MKTLDLVVVGGGSAGLSGAVAAYDEGLRDILIIERNPVLGGILNQCIHNGFGLGEFKEELTGPEFASRFIAEAEKRKIPFATDAYVTEVTNDRVVRYSDKEGFHEVQAKAVLFTAGCYERSAGAISLPGDRPAGVMTAGVAQLLLNQYGYLPGKRVFILGSGDIGLIMARRLTLEGAKVLGVAELCAYSNGLNRNIVQCLEDYDIPLYLSHTVSRVYGRTRLEAIDLSEVGPDGKIVPDTAAHIECDALILSIGLIPNNTLLSAAGAKTGASRGAAVDQHYETSVPGIYSAGNVLHVHDLADNVVEEARYAGRAAARFVLGRAPKRTSSTPVSAAEGVGYVVPSSLSFPLEEKISFKFRVRKPMKALYLVIKQGDKEVKRVFKPFLIPSEMEILTLPSSLFEEGAGPIVVAALPKEA